ARAAGGAGARRPRAAQARPAAEDERRVLLGARARRRRHPAAARARDVRLLACRRLVGAHPRAEAHRPPVPAVREVHRARAPLAAVHLVTTLAEAAAQADALAKENDVRGLANLRNEWPDEREPAARSKDFLGRTGANRAI